MRKFGTVCLALISVAMVQGCSSHWADEVHEFGAECWTIGDTIGLEFENEDTAQVYRMSLPVVLSQDYPFHNIYLRVQVQSPSGDVTVIPAEFQLADRAGVWLTETKGDLAPFELVMVEGMQFSQVGTYRLGLYHYMRDEQLCGVESAGIAIDAVSQD